MTRNNGNDSGTGGVIGHSRNLREPPAAWTSAILGSVINDAGMRQRLSES